MKVTGNTDYVGSAAYNDKLALARAEAVKAFLVKYGASADQITTAGDGKRDPEVDNRTKEGRFMNRRVVLDRDRRQRQAHQGGRHQRCAATSDGDAGSWRRSRQDCCDQILKRLDKLDDILAALKNLQGENDHLQGELADLRNQQNALKDQVNGLPKPLTEPQAQAMIAKQSRRSRTGGGKAEAQQPSLSNVGINIGPTFGDGRANTGHFTASPTASSSRPSALSGTHAVQAQGEYMYFPGIQEGQFDIGLVNRWATVQAGAFASFKYLNFGQYQHGATLGQAAFLLDYLFNRGKVGVFGTKAFKPFAVLNSIKLAPGAFMQTCPRGRPGRRLRHRGSLGPSLLRGQRGLNFHP